MEAQRFFKAVRRRCVRFLMLTLSYALWLMHTRKAPRWVQLLALALFACSRVPYLADDKLSAVYSALPEAVLPFLKKYALDSLAVLVIVSISNCGYRAGALNGMRSIFMTFGILAAVIFGMFLPFSAWAGTGEEAKAICIPVRAIADKYKILFEKSEKLANRASLFSKLAAGLTLSALFALVIVLHCA